MCGHLSRSTILLDVCGAIPGSSAATGEGNFVASAGQVHMLTQLMLWLSFLNTCIFSLPRATLPFQANEAPAPSPVDLLDLDDGGDGVGAPAAPVSQSPSPQNGDMLLLDMV